MPGLGKSLISIEQMASSRVKLILDGDDCYINFKSSNKQQMQYHINIVSNLYPIGFGIIS